MAISWMVYCRMSKIIVPKFTCHSSYRPFFVPQTGMLPPTLRTSPDRHQTSSFWKAISNKNKSLQIIYVIF